MSGIYRIEFLYCNNNNNYNCNNNNNINNYNYNNPSTNNLVTFE